VTRWPGGDGFDAVFRWPTRLRQLPDVALEGWLFDPPVAGRDEWWARCVAWCRANDFPVVDLLRMRRWRRGQAVSRFPDDPEGMFPVELFGVDRDR
jgi:hypothetical protein